MSCLSDSRWPRPQFRCAGAPRRLRPRLLRWWPSALPCLSASRWPLPQLRRPGAPRRLESLAPSCLGASCCRECRGRWRRRSRGLTGALMHGLRQVRLAPLAPSCASSLAGASARPRPRGDFGGRRVGRTGMRCGVAFASSVVVLQAAGEMPPGRRGPERPHRAAEPRARWQRARRGRPSRLQGPPPCCLSPPQALRRPQRRGKRCGA